MPSTILEWQQESYDVSASKGFHDNDDNIGPAERLLLAVSEITEAFEELRDGHATDEIYLVKGKPEGVPIEIADTVIRLFDFCETYNIDLEAALLLKNAFNKTRPFKHGRNF